MCWDTSDRSDAVPIRRPADLRADWPGAAGPRMGDYVVHGMDIPVTTVETVNLCVTRR